MKEQILVIRNLLLFRTTTMAITICCGENGAMGADLELYTQIEQIATKVPRKKTL